MAQVFTGLLCDCPAGSFQSGFLVRLVIPGWVQAQDRGPGPGERPELPQPCGIAPSYSLPGNHVSPFCIQSPPGGQRSGLLIPVQLPCPAESWRRGDAERSGLDFMAGRKGAPTLKVGVGGGQRGGVREDRSCYVPAEHQLTQPSAGKGYRSRFTDEKTEVRDQH